MNRQKKPGHSEQADLLIDSGALEAISFECECGCRVEIPWSAAPKDGHRLPPLRYRASRRAEGVEGIDEAFAWAIGDGERIRFRLLAKPRRAAP